MGFFSGIASFFKKIGDLLKKIFDAIKAALAVILLVIAAILIVWACVATGGAVLVVFGFAISQSVAVLIGVLAITGAFLIDGETASKVVGKVGDALGEAAGAIAGAATKIAGGVLGGVFGALSEQPLFWVALGVGTWYLLRDDSPAPEPDPQVTPVLGVQDDPVLSSDQVLLA